MSKSKRIASYTRQSSEWSKPSWSLPLNKKPIKGRFTDDPKAVNEIMNGKVSQRYGTIELSDLYWTMPQQKKAGERNAIHQFKKKYYND